MGLISGVTEPKTTKDTKMASAFPEDEIVEYNNNNVKHRDPSEVFENGGFEVSFQSYFNSNAPSTLQVIYPTVRGDPR